MICVESPWSSDPLEFFGGFHSLEYDPNALFKSPLAFNGTVSWLKFTAELSYPSPSSVKADLTINFLPSMDWPFLQDVYGWAGHQWLGWARGEISVMSEGPKTLALNTKNVLEFWVDDTRYFGGDFYGFGRAAVTLHLPTGTHRIDVKLVGDVRSVGGIGDPIVDVSLALKESSHGLSLLYYADEDVMMSDVIGGDFGPLVSPYASVIVRNDAKHDIYVRGFEGMSNVCEIELLREGPIKVVPGQTRPIGFRLECVPSYNRRIYLDLKYHINGENQERSVHVSTWPKVVEGTHVLHKMTYVHPSGVVSWAILRPPSARASCGSSANLSLPVMLALHGANVNANDYSMMHSFDPLPDLCAWLLIPQGTTPWSGDDWHSWGFADVEAAIAAIPEWIEQLDWKGPGVDVTRWFVAGHSNGGQGAWYALTHRPDNVFAAAVLSAYSSIQNYVPYVSWRTADPGKTALVQASLSSYRHELLMENAKDIPIIIQHSSKDTNVPAYHSRLMDMLIEEARGESAYFETPDERHFWKGLITTKPLSDFYKRHLDCNTTQSTNLPVNLRTFSIVVADPGDMGPKNGVQILQLRYNGQLGRMDFTFDPLVWGCVFRSSNIIDFRISPPLDICDGLWIDGKEFATSSPSSSKPSRFVRSKDGWKIWDDTTSTTSGLPERQGRQLGAMDSILRTRGAFKIVRHSRDTGDIALQVSRNLCQYFAADTEVTDDYDEALASEGNVISISIGADMPHPVKDEYEYPIIAWDADVMIRDPLGRLNRGYEDHGFGVAAIFLRPLPNERLHLVVWGMDKQSLEVVARLVPMMTGSGQPDWVVTDKTMMWKGLQGTLALGFFEWDWEVSRNSYFT